MAGVQSGTRQVRRLAGWVLFGAPLALAAFMACGGGTPGDTDGGAGNGSDAGGADGDSGGSGATGSGGGPGGADGSGGEAGPGDPEPIDLEEYCLRSSELNYDYLMECYGSIAFSDDDREAYVARTEERCMLAGGAIEAGRLEYDAALGAACVEALEELDCVA